MRGRVASLWALSGTLLTCPAALATGGDLDALDLQALFNNEVVSATRSRQDIREAPAIIAVITDRDLRERNLGSVAEALRTVPGFSVLYDHYNYNVGVRGISPGMRGYSRTIKVMINNQPTALRTDATHFLGPELIPVGLIKRIEIIRGPGSALYGADAYLGVINIVTKTGRELFGGQVALGAGSAQRGQVQADLVYGQAWDVGEGRVDMAVGGTDNQADRSGLRVAATSPLRQSFEGVETTGDRARNQSLFGAMSLRSDTFGTLSVTASSVAVDSSHKFADWSLSQRLLDSQNRMAVNARFVNASLEKELNEHLTTSAGAAYVDGGPTQDLRYDVNNPHYFQVPASGYRGFDANAQAHYRFGDRHMVTAGADYTDTDHSLQTTYTYFRKDFGRNKAGDLKPTGEAAGNMHFVNTGLYAQGLFYPLEPLGVTVGVREDFHSVYGSVANSRAVMVYRWTDALTSKLLYGTSFKAPSAAQLFSTPIVFGDLIGNPDLKPENAQTVETELSWEATDTLRLATNAYMTTAQNVVQFVPVATMFQAKNIARASTVGVEGSVQWSRAGLHAFLNGAFASTSVTGQPNAIYTSNDLRSEMFPTLMVNAGAMAELPWVPVDVYLEGRYVASMKPSQSNFIKSLGDETYEIPASTLLDLSLNSRYFMLFDRDVRLSFKVSNLLDGTVIYPGVNGVDVPGLGRTFSLRLTQNF